jgi:hypothetical protein
VTSSTVFADRDSQQSVKLEHPNEFDLDPKSEPCWRHNDYLNTFQVQVSAGLGLGVRLGGAAGDQCTSNRSRVAASLSHGVTVTVLDLMPVPGASEHEMLLLGPTQCQSS